MKIVQMMILDSHGPLVREGQVWENANTLNFMESVDDGLNTATDIQQEGH